jgi:hypothetical protein
MPLSWTPKVSLLFLFLHIAAALLQCPDSIGWAIIPQDGADGSWHISENFDLSTTLVSTNEVSVKLSFTLISAFDNSSLPCSAAGEFASVNTGRLEGSCVYAEGGVMGNTDTIFTFDLDRSPNGGNAIYIKQNFSCIWNNHSRP